MTCRQEHLRAHGPFGLDGETRVADVGRVDAVDGERRRSHAGTAGTLETDLANERGAVAWNERIDRSRGEPPARGVLRDPHGRAARRGGRAPVTHAVADDFACPRTRQEIEQYPAYRAVGPALEHAGLRRNGTAVRGGDPQTVGGACTPGGQRNTDRDRLRDACDTARLRDGERDAQGLGPSARGAQQERRPDDTMRAHGRPPCQSPCATANVFELAGPVLLT